MFTSPLFLFLAACDPTGSSSEDLGNPETGQPMLHIRMAVDPDQARLDNLGRPAGISDGNAAQTPDVRQIGIHYVELVPTATTLLGEGAVVYVGKETDEGGETAIDFAEEALAAPGEVIVSIPLSEITSGEYAYMRVSVAYQEFDVDVLIDDALSIELTGTVGSFVGYNTYIESFSLGDETVQVNGDKPQGFWAVDTTYAPPSTGQAPAQATTVPNILWDSAPIPAGSCVVTAELQEALHLTGAEEDDVTLVMSLSTNQSFEWREVNPDGRFEPIAGEMVVDMGLRGAVAWTE